MRLQYPLLPRHLCEAQRRAISFSFFSKILRLFLLVLVLLVLPFLGPCLGPSFWSYVSEALLFYRVCIVERVAMDTERDRVGVYSEVSGAPPESVEDGVVVVV